MKFTKLKFFFKLGYIEFKKFKKLNFLAIFSLMLCFIVFFISLMIYKVTPLLVWFLSQTREGPYDAVIFSNNAYNGGYNFMKYDKIKEKQFKNINMVGRSLTNQYFVKKSECFVNNKYSFKLLLLCSKFQEFDFYRINLKEEQNFGYLKNIKESSIQGNNVVINQSIKKLLNLNIGDIIVIKYNINYIQLEKIYKLIKDFNPKFKVDTRINDIVLPIEFIVKDIIDDSKMFGTFLGEKFKIFIDNENFNNHIASEIFKISEKSKKLKKSLYEFANNYRSINDNDWVNIIYLSFKNRIDIYQETKYSVLRNKLISNLGEINNYFGSFSFTFQLNILRELYHTQQPAALMKMITNVLITLLIVGCIYWLYNIFILNSDFKIYETGMFRTFGINKTDIIYLFSAQGSIIYIFSIIPSYLIITGVLIFINVKFKELITFDSYILPNFGYMFLINILIYFIPIISLIIPTRKLIGKSLIESLEKNRSKTESIIINIVDKKKNDFVHYFTFASFAILIGSFLYYVFPVAIINLNYELVFMIIFFLVLIILIGFGLFSANIQNIVEKVWFFIFLIFEKSYIKNIVKMNLISHKIKNKKTSIIFSIALTFIQFAYVAFISLTVINKNFRFNRTGSKIYMENEDFNTLAILKNTLGEYLELAWITGNLKYLINNNLDIKNLGKTITSNTNIRAISSNYINFIENYRFLDISKDKYLASELSPSEFLYTREGHNTCLISSFIYDKFYLNGNGKFIVTSNGSDNRNLIVSKKFYSINQSRGNFRFSILISYPKFMEISQYYSNRSTIIQYLLIKPKGISEEELIKKLKQNGFNYYFHGGEEEYNKFIETFKLILVGGSWLILLICYLSLNIAMISNINEEKKDIAILRNLGVTKLEIYRIFFYEAFILLVVSSISGIIMGSLLGLLLLLNLSIITPIGIHYLLFWEIIVLIISFGFLSSFISTFIPLRVLLKKKTVTIMNEIN